MNPKTELTNGRLDFFETRSFLLKLHHHLRLTNLAPQIGLDPIALLWIRGDGDEEEEQGPRISYSGERRWGATHRRWRRREWNTQTVHDVGIRLDMVRFLREWAEDKGEERRGGSLTEGRRIGDRVPKRRKKGGGKGGLVRGREHGSREPIGC